MASEKRCSTSYLIFGASLRHGSLNDRLASLAATVVEEKGGTVDRVQMSDLDCPSYNHDVEAGTGIPAGADRLRSKLWFESTLDCFIDAVEAVKHYPKMKTQWIEFLGERPTPETERVETSMVPKA